MKTGRNEPCPCGSGKKYKHCCLASETVAAAEPDAIAAQRKALDWLLARFGKSKQGEIFDTYFEFVDQFSETDDHYDDDASIELFLSGLKGNDRYLVAIGINDWALHETTYERHGETMRGVDWVLHTRDAHLSASQRAFLEATAASHLHVYEVTGIELERGLHLRDVFKPDEPAQFVHEGSATRSLRPGALVGVRVIEHAGRLELAGAIYPLSAIGVLELLADRDHASDDAPHVAGRFPAKAIRDLWLLDRLQPSLMRGLPQTVAAEVEHVYDVLDVDALHEALLASGEAEPLGESRAQWIREPDDADDIAVLRHPLVPSEPPESRWRRFAHAHTNSSSADRTRAWLETVAGAHLRHREREYRPESHFDPFRLPLPDAGSASRTRDTIIAAYANWCDETIGVLSGTPRQMQGDARGRYRTHLLLNGYDDTERMFAQVEQREPVSFDFLREALGLPLARDAS